MAFLSSTPIDIEYLNSRRWWRRVDIRAADECWPWLLSTGSHGYGQTWDKRTVRVAHRVAWTLHYQQQIPSGMTIDHTCHNRICCNPNHLRLLDNVTNARANGMSRRTHCPHGHAYDDANTYVDPSGGRRCRACNSIRNQHPTRRRF